MQNDNGRMRFGVELDTAKLRADAMESQRILNSIGKTAVENGDRMDEMLKKVGKGFASIVSIGAFAQLAKQIVAVRGEIQSLEVAFNTLTGSAEVGGKLLADIRQFAVSTPMQMNDLAKGAQTLLAFNTEAEDVMPILKALGDISMGDAAKFQSLTLAFSQMSSTGKLMGQDLMQMINAGFNPLSVISEQTGKSIGELKDEMSKGAISAEMVKQAFIDVTSEGGKFYGMLESQSHTLNGAISNLQGAIQDTFNSIGEASEGAIAGAVDVVTKLVKNYEKVGSVLIGLVSTYGAYKAAVIAVSVAEKVRYQATLAQMAGYTKFGALMEILKEKTNALTKAIMKNPYAVAAAAITALAYGIYKLATYETQAEKAHKEFVKTVNEGKQAVDAEAIKVDKLFDNLKKAKEGTDEWKEAREKVMNQYGSYLQKLGNELTTVEDIAAAHIKVKNAILEEARAKQYNTAIEKASETAATAQAEVFEALRKYIDKSDKVSNKDEIFDKIKEQLLMYSSTGDEIYFKTAYQNFSNYEKKSGYSFGRYPFDEFNKFRKSVEQLQNDMKAADTAFGGSAKKTEEAATEEAKTIQQLRDEFDKLSSAEQTVSNDTYASIKQREKELKGYKELGEQIEWLQKVQKSSNDNEVVKDAEKRIEALKKQQDAITGKGTAAKAEDEAEKKRLAAQKLQKEIDDYYKAAEDAEREGALELEQQRINLMEDGYEKEEAQIALDYAKRKLSIEQLEKKYIEDLIEVRKKEWQKANPNAKESEWVRPTLSRADLSAGQQNQLKQMEELNERTKAERTKNLLKDLLKQYQTYEQSRTELLRQYSEKRKLMYEDDGVTIKEGLEGNVEELDRQQKESLEALDEAYAQHSEEYKAFVNSLSKMKRDELKEELQNIIEGLLEVADGSEEYAILKAMKKQVENRLADYDDKNEDEEKEDKEYEAFKERMRDYTSKVLQLADAFGIMDDAVGSAFANMVQSCLNSRTPLEALTNFLIGAINVFKTAIIESERSFIDGIQREADLYDSFIKDHRYQNFDEFYKDFLGFDPRGAAAGYGYELLFDVTRWGYSEEKLHKFTSELMASLQEFAASAANVRGQFDIGPIIENSTKKIEEMNRKLAELRKHPKRNADEIEEYIQQIEEAAYEYVQLLTDTMDNLLGGFNSITGQLADALISAFQEGTDAAKSWGDTVDDIIRNIARNIIIGQLIEKPLTEFLNRFISSDMSDKAGENGWFRSNGEINWDNVRESLPAIEEYLNSLYEGVSDAAKPLLDLFNTSSSREAASKGIATASQETVDELNGRITAVQGHTYQINETTKLMLLNTNAILLSVQAIEHNTDRLISMEGDLGSVRSDLNYIRTHGVTIN